VHKKVGSLPDFFVHWTFHQNKGSIKVFFLYIKFEILPDH